MGTLTNEQILQAQVVRELGSTQSFQAHVERIQAAAARTREEAQILSGGSARLDPETPTKVRVLAPFTHGGAVAAVDSTIEVPLHLAQSLAAIHRCEIV